MALYPPELPWLSQARGGRRGRRTRSSPARSPRAASSATSTTRERAARGRAVLAAAARAASPLGASTSGSRCSSSTRRRTRSSARSTTSRALRADLPSGSFVFVVSDFLAPPPLETWLHARSLALGRRPRDRPGPRLGAELPRARVGDRAVRRAGDGTRRHRPLVTVGGACTPRRERGAPRGGCSASFAASVSTRSSSARATRSQIDREFLAWAELRRQGRRRAR